LALLKLTNANAKPQIDIKKSQAHFPSFFQSLKGAARRKERGGLAPEGSVIARLGRR
jgi:hypothetical protein